MALVVIKIEGLDETSRARIIREAMAMGRLGNHPHVLPMHDLDEEEGQSYMVQPSVAGGDVESLRENAEDHCLTIEQAIDPATQVC